MGFAVRAGAELDVIISASGRVLLAFQDEETRKLRIEESLQRRPEQADPQIDSILDKIRVAGYESIPERAGARPVGGELSDPRHAGPRNRRADRTLCRTHRPDAAQVDPRSNRGARCCCANSVGADRRGCLFDWSQPNGERKRTEAVAPL